MKDYDFKEFFENVYDSIRSLFEKPSEIETEDENEPNSALPASIESNSGTLL